MSAKTITSFRRDRFGDGPGRLGASASRPRSGSVRGRRKDSGFALMLVLLMGAIIAITLYYEIPRIAFDAQRQKEQLLVERGEQYKRAIYMFVKANNRWPTRVEELERFNTRHYLRNKYKDPMTGKDEWRLIHVQNGILTDSLISKQTPEKTTSTAGQYVGEVAGIGQAPVNSGQQGVNLAMRQRASDSRPAGAGAEVPDQPPAQVGNPQNQIPGQPNQMPGQIPGQPNQMPGQFPGQMPGQMTGQMPPGTVYPGGQGQLPGQTVPGQGIIPGQGLSGQGAVPVQGIPGQMPGRAVPQPVQLPGGQQFIPGQTQPVPPGFFPGQPGTTPFGGGRGGFPPGANPNNNTAANSGSSIGGGAYIGGGASIGSQPSTPATGQTGAPLPGQPGFPVNSQTGGVSPYPTSPGSIGSSPNFGQPGMQMNPQGQMNPAQQNPATQFISQILTSGRPGGAPQINAGGIMGAGIAGVASNAEQDSIMVYGDRTKYNEWEFIHDPLKVRTPMNPLTGAVGAQLGTPISQSGTQPGVQPTTQPTPNSIGSGPFGQQPMQAPMQNPGAFGGFGQPPAPTPPR